MFSFCHNFCWLLGENFINCEILTDYCNGHSLTISEIKILLNEGTVLIDTLDEEGNETRNILQYMYLEPYTQP